MSDGPAVVVVNEAGTNVAAVTDASTAAVATDKALVVAVSPNNTVPVSAASLPLPTGAATEATLALIKAKTDNLDVALSTRAVTGLTDTQLRASAVPVSAASLPLPAGAATSANQTTLGNQTTKINDGTNTAAVSAANALKVDGSAVTQPVSGTVTANVGTTNGLALDATLSAQSLVDNAGFIDGTSRVQPSGYILDEVAGTALTENDVGAARIDSKRAQVQVIEDATTRGQRLAITASNAAKVDGSAVTQPVSGTVAVSGSVAVTGPLTDTQLRASAVPVSAASLPLPTGAATAAKQPALGTAGTASADVISVQGIASMTPLKTDGSATTQPVSAASLPLPTGASTAAKQPALGTAGTASADVLSVQGIAGMTALKVDGSGVTQPVSGTVTANAGTNLNTSALALDATLTGGTQRSKITDGTNNAAVKAASTVPVAADPALVVAVSPNTPTLPTKLSSSTATTSTVASSATTVQLLAANTSRLGVTIYNDSTKILYVKLGTTASTTDFTTQIDKDGYYEVPFGYTGRIDGIWASANGNARITELT